VQRGRGYVLSCLLLTMLFLILMPGGAASGVVVVEHPNEVKLTPGGGAVFNVWLENTHLSQSREVNITLVGLPAGVVAEAGENVSIPPNTSQMVPITLRAGESVPLGTYPLQMVVSFDGGTSTADISLRVVELYVYLPKNVSEPPVEGVSPEELATSMSTEEVQTPTSKPKGAAKKVRTPSFDAVMLLCALGALAVIGKRWPPWS